MRHRAIASAMLQPSRLTLGLWRQLHRQASDYDDNCHIEHSGYGVMVSFLLRWRASVYRLLWLDLLIWAAIFVVISLIYRLPGYPAWQRQLFEDAIRTIGFWSKEIPIYFLLGFFVSSVVSRWWDMYNMIPKIGGVSLIIRTCIRNLNTSKGLTDIDRAQRIRRDISRYLNLAWVLCMWELSGHLRNRFHILRKIIGSVNAIQPEEVREEHIKYNELYNFRRSRNDPLKETLERVQVTESMQAANIDLLIEDLCLLNEDPVVKRSYGDLITKSEVEVFRKEAERQQQRDNEEAETLGVSGFTGQQRRLYRVQWWLPLHWALALAEQSLEEGFLIDAGLYLTVTSAIHEFGAALNSLSNYATRSLPLVYTQVGIVAIYTLFFVTTVSQQFIDPSSAAARSISGYWLDYYVPVFGLLQVVFTVGWFKVALVMLDPFGSDDGDFLLGDVFNGNLYAGKEMCTNELHLYPPKLRQVIRQSAAKCNIDCLHSEPEDVEAVVLQAQKHSSKGKVYFANSILDQMKEE